MSKMKEPKRSRKLEDYAQDSMYLQSLADAVDLAQIEALAIEKALDSHPVTKFVKHLPIERIMYPATSGKHPSQNGETPYLSWTLPMRDRTISKRLGCGLFEAKGQDMLFVACTQNKKDYAKSMCLHCWTLGCTNCGNSTAIRKGVDAESRILSLKDINIRKGRKAEDPRHWVISPPQEWAKKMLTLPNTFRELYQSVIDMAKKYGLHSGCIITHPWRLNGNSKLKIPPTKWEVGPHFHIVGYGFVDTEGFREEAESLAPGETDEDKKWVIKLIHPDKPIRSVRQTVAYLLTHAGLNSYMRLDKDVNFCDLFGIYAQRNEEGEFKDIDELKMDRDDFWERWTMKKMKGYFHSLNYFGDIRTNVMRVYDTYKDQMVRECPECGAPMGIFNGIHDCNPEPAIYNKESKIYVQEEDYAFVKQVHEEHRIQLYFDGNTLLDFAMAVPQLSCPETQGVQEHKPNCSQEFLKDRRNHTIVYVKHPSGYGLQPMRVTIEEARRMEKEGSIA